MSGFDYYYGEEADQFSFYRIPKILFTDNNFKKMSCDAKVLYGLLLDRMGLSIKNKWFDSNNRVYIIFTLEDAKERLNCGKDKCINLFKELEQNAGLIERKRQGLGKPSLIYVKNINRKLGPKLNQKNSNNGIETSRVSDIEKSEVISSENTTSGLLERKNLDVDIPECNNTDFNYLDLNNQSISPDKGDGLERYNYYYELVKENIDYSYACESYGSERVNSILEIMIEILCSKKPYLWINQDKINTRIVVKRFLQINYTHLEYIFDSLDKNTTKIYNIKNYLITTIYNAPVTIDQYYSSLVNHDLYGRDKI